MREIVASIAPDTMPPNTLQQLLSNEQLLLPMPRYDEAFYLYSFKIAPCNNSLSHNWSLCPFVHAKEKARRRWALAVGRLPEPPAPPRLRTSNSPRHKQGLCYSEKVVQH